MSAHRKPVGPYSRTLERGAVGQSIDARSIEGRFLRSFERKLIDHVGGAPSATQRMLISRLARVALQLEMFDRKILAGEVLTGHDARVYGALHNALRLGLRELGMQPTKAKAPSLAEHLARKAAEKAAAA